MRYPSLFLVLIVTSFFQCTPPIEREDPDVLRLTAQPTTPERFGESLVTTGMYERDMAIHPDGAEIIYTLGDRKQTRRCLVTSRFVGDAWTPPEVLNISGRYQDIEPFLASDGERLFFASDRPLTADAPSGDYNIWYSDRTEAGWGEPVALNEHVNTDGDEFYPSIARNGNLYFTATRPEGRGREDIYRSRWEDGTYQPAELLDTTINTAYYEFNAYISPDEDYLIFSSWGRPDGLGGGDLYLARRADDDRWLPARHLPAPVNSDKLDYCPFVDGPRGNLYFTSERIDTFTREQPFDIHMLRDVDAASGNGFGDVYRVSVESLGWD